MPIIYTYPSATPAAEDLILISDVSATNPSKATRKCTIGDIVGLVGPLVAGGGTVTEVDATTDTTTSAGGFALTTNPAMGITTTGDVDLAWSGAGGDMLYGKDDGLGNISLEKLTIASAPVGNGDVLTIAGGVPTWATPAAGGGGVTSVGTTNNMGVGSGIKFLAGPNPIVGAGSIDLAFNGVTGDILFADSVTSLKKLSIGTSTTNPTGSISNQVLAVDSTGPDPLPVWATKEVAILDGGVNVELAAKSINFTGAGVTATSTGAGLVAINIPGGGGSVTESEGSFTPILVTQGVDGTGALEDLAAAYPGFTYTSQFGRYYILNKQVYIDFYIEFNLGPEPVAIIDTLGVSLGDGVGGVLGLQAIDPLAANLNQTTKNNAGVDITDIESNGGVLSIIGWDHAPQGGKLNKFYGVGNPATNFKSVAWFYWLSQPILAGEIRTEYNVSAGSWANTDPGKSFTIAGSLNPIVYQNL